MENIIELDNVLYMFEPSDKKNKKYNIYAVLFSKDNKTIKKRWKKYVMDGLEADQIYKKYISSF